MPLPVAGKSGPTQRTVTSRAESATLVLPASFQSLLLRRLLILTFVHCLFCIHGLATSAHGYDTAGAAAHR
jgi:hypothetical protein